MIITLSFVEHLARILVTLIGYVSSITVAGYIAAFINKMVGDDTAQEEGFLSLNPKIYTDPFALLCFILLGIGWKRNIPFDEERVDGSFRPVKLFFLYSSEVLGHLMCAIFAIGGILLLFGPHVTRIVAPIFNHPGVPMGTLAHVVHQASGLSISIGLLLLKIIFLSIFFAAFSFVLNILRIGQELLGLGHPHSPTAFADRSMLTFVLVLFIAPVITDAFAYVLAYATISLAILMGAS